MVPGEILKHIATILISILTAAATTFLMNYMKDKKRKMVEQITFNDDRIRILDSIALNSSLSFIIALIIVGANLMAIINGLYNFILWIVFYHGHLDFINHFDRYFSE